MGSDTPFKDQSYKEFEALGEKAYDQMYETFTEHGTYTNHSACWSDCKDWFAAAIGAAEREGLDEEASRLRARFEHIRKVYRSQFS
jgi:uncharacterized protein (DUF2126 family)